MNTKIVFMNELSGAFLKLGCDCADSWTNCGFNATEFDGAAVKDAHKHVGEHKGKFVKLDISDVSITDAETAKDGIFFEW